MRTFTLIVMAMLFMLIARSQEISDKCEEHIACVVTNISGKCSVRDGDKPQGNPLTSKNSIGKKLLAGQSVQCNSGGYIRVFFCASKKEIEIKGNRKKWYTVPNVPASVPEDGDSKILGRKRPWKRVAVYFSIPYRDQLKKLEDVMAVNTAGDRNSDTGERATTTAGRVADSPEMSAKRGGIGAVGGILGGLATGRSTWEGRSVRIISPSRYSKVWPDSLTFRWQPVSHKSNLTLSIRTIDGVLLWTQSGIDGKLGRFYSSEASAALKRFRAENPNSLIRFSAWDQNRVLHASIVSLLSIEDEESLKQELSELDDEEGFLLHIYRADAFHRRQLYSEEADEYEIVLNSSPESEDVLVATLIANCLANNAGRAAELAQQLPPRHPYRTSLCRH